MAGPRVASLLGCTKAGCARCCQSTAPWGGLLSGGVTGLAGFGSGRPVSAREASSGRLARLAGPHAPHPWCNGVRCPARCFSPRALGFEGRHACAVVAL